LDNEELTGENSRKLRKALDEFDTYVVVNEALIPNYANAGVMRKLLPDKTPEDEFKTAC
jgi:hypothetical protein